MRYKLLRQIKPLYFSYVQISDMFSISPESAKVFCSRYVKNGLLIRIKRDVYILTEKWENLNIQEQMRLTNIIQVPSYISLNSALTYYGYSTQIQQKYIESICLKRSYNKIIGNYEFSFIKIAEPLYHSFIKHDGFFIAKPEKAVADALYLKSLGRYEIDFSALDISKFNFEELKQIFCTFPKKVLTVWKNYADI